MDAMGWTYRNGSGGLGADVRVVQLMINDGTFA